MVGLSACEAVPETAALVDWTTGWRRPCLDPLLYKGVGDCGACARCAVRSPLLARVARLWHAILVEFVVRIPTLAAGTAPKAFPRRRCRTLARCRRRGRPPRNFVDPQAGQVTVGDWSQRWLAAASGHLKIKTIAGNESLLKTKIMPRFGAVPLSGMKQIMVNEWVTDLGSQGLSSSSVRQSYRLLSQIMRSAADTNLIAATPCRGVRLPRMPQTEPHIVTPKQADLIAAATPAPHDALIMLLAYAGLRIGEAFAVRRSSFDVDARTISVTEKVVEIGGQLSFDTPKSHQKRSVTLPEFVVVRLRVALAGIDAAPDALLFDNSRGGPQHYTGWRRSYFDPAVRAVGLTDFTPHDLRASHATWVAERHGVMAAAARLGHARASVTTRHY
ncbi:MAG: tyrosine-type recombinase/integrase, partial [Jatrophihabitantaceae bacterium]